MEPISPTDALFLVGESREHPMHVGALQLFEPPDDVGPGFVRESYQAMLGCTEIQPTFRKHPAFFGGITNVAWSFDKDVELGTRSTRSTTTPSWTVYRRCGWCNAPSPPIRKMTRCGFRGTSARVNARSLGNEPRWSSGSAAPRGRRSR
jgi:hypothetical protein